MKYLKKFEELNFSNVLPSTSISNLTNYYKCKECSELFKRFNRQLSICPTCGSNNIFSINIDKFYQEVKDRLGKDFHTNVNKIKQEEEDNLIDLYQLPIINIDESVGEEKITKAANIFFSAILSPITIPIFANLPTEKKIKFLIKSITDNYLEEKAEYELLDDVKYDIEQPTKLDIIRSRLKTISNKLRKYPSVIDYIEDAISFMKFTNIFNFRNKKDTEYIFDKVKEYFSKISEKELIENIKKELIFDEKKVKAKKL